MHNMLIIDGHDDKEAGEGDLVRTLAERCNKFSVQWADHRNRWPFPKILVDGTIPYSVVWFTGHLTVWKRSGQVALQRRKGRVFETILTPEELSLLKPRLLVLSTCNGEYLAERVRINADMAVYHRGKVEPNNTLVFAAAFFSELTLQMTKRKLTYEQVSGAYTKAWRAANAHRSESDWRFIAPGVK